MPILMKSINLFVSLILVFSSFLNAQEDFEVRLVPTNNGDNPKVICFDTQFKNISEKDVKLSGQNYRLYYDALQLKFLKPLLQSYLPENSYGNVDINQSLHNIDARGYGNLKFSQNLGFINYSIRSTEDTDKIIVLPSFSGWLSTTNICFQATDPLGPKNIIWARQGLTNGYATAFTELSVLDDNENSYPGIIQIYQDYIKLSEGKAVNDPMVLQTTTNNK